MKLTWFGTASVAMETASSKVLFDPFIPLEGSLIKTTGKDYEGYNDIVITHGHVDHISSLPAICGGTDKQIYCTETPYNTLLKMGLSGKNLNKVEAGKKLVFGDISVTPYDAKHIKFDLPIIFETVFSWRNVKYRKNAPDLYGGFKKYPENEEIKAYLVEAEGKRIFIMGSLGLRPEVKYPDNIDVLVLPYQGRRDILEPAVAIVERLCPKRIILDHFDDTFPPMSREIDTEKFEKLKLLADKGIRVERPEHGKKIEI